MRTLLGFGLIVVLAIHASGTLALVAAGRDEAWLASTAPEIKIAADQDGTTRILSAMTAGEFTVESTQTHPARTGDSFEVIVRLKADLTTRALPELACYDAQGQEIPAPSSIARGNPFVTTEWQAFQRVFVVRPGTASVRARIRATGRGVVAVAGLEFRPKKIDPYETGALITQPHAKRRQGVVLESNFGIVNRELLSDDDRDGDGKWAVVTVDLDRLTAPAKKGEDWRSGFEDNPNVILWSDGAVLKSDTTRDDRAPDRGSALHYLAHIHPGPYAAKINDPGRAVAVSLDGNTWQRFEGGDEIELGTLAAADGIVEFWIDACYRDPVSVGPAYFDYVRLVPAIDAPSIDRIFAAAKKKPEPAMRGSAEERRVTIAVDAPPLPGVATWPARCGLPIPRGELLSANKIMVLDAAGTGIPSQNRVLATWPDGSARWIFLDFMHRPKGKTSEGNYTVVYGNAAKAAPAPRGTQLHRTAAGVEVDTGAIRFLVSGTRFGLVEQVRLASGKVVQADPIVAEIVEADGRTWNATDLPVTKLEIERPGPLHSVILVETALAESGKPSAGFHHRARIHAFADSPLVEIDYFVANTDSRPAGEVAGSMSSKLAAKSVSLKVRPAQAITAAQHALGSAGSSGALVQKSEEEALTRAHGQVHELRARVPGWVALELADGGGLAAGVADFREQFPKALRWSSRELEVGLWAEEGGPFEWIEGVGKTHHVALVYGTAAAANGEILSCGPQLAVAAPEWYTRSGAMGRIGVAGGDVLPAVERTLVRHMKDPVIGRVGLGFENYGDHSSGGYVKGTFLWDNNEYDLPAACLVHFARTGDREALRIGLASALHYVDVDTIHYSSLHPDWARAQHVHSHGVFGHHTSQGPDMNHAGYVQGLIWYTYFTGEPAGILGAQGIADWALANLGIHATAMERALGHPLMSLNDVYEATGDEKYLRGSAHLVDQALKWENPVRSGFPAPITESPAYYSGCPFNAGLTFSALMKFNSWANLAEIDAMLERLAQWTLADVWRPPGSIQSKGGSPRRGGQAQHIANHGRLMAHVFERTRDPFYLVVPQTLVAAGFGDDARNFFTRDTGLVYNYLPWFLAALAENGNPLPDPRTEVTATPDSLRLGRSGKAAITVTVKNNGPSPIDDLRCSLHSRRDVGIRPQSVSYGALQPGQSATFAYEIEAPANLNASGECNRIAYAHWSALFRRSGKAHLSHRVIRVEFDPAPRANAH